MCWLMNEFLKSTIMGQQEILVKIFINLLYSSFVEHFIFSKEPFFKIFVEQHIYIFFLTDFLD